MHYGASQKFKRKQFKRTQVCDFHSQNALEIYDQ